MWRVLCQSLWPDALRGVLEQEAAAQERIASFVRSQVVSAPGTLRIPLWLYCMMLAAALRFAAALRLESGSTVRATCRLFGARGAAALRAIRSLTWLAAYEDPFVLAHLGLPVVEERQRTFRELRAQGH